MGRLSASLAMLALASTTLACGSGGDSVKPGSGGGSNGGGGGSGGSLVTTGGSGGGGAGGASGGGGGPSCDEGPGYKSTDPSHFIARLDGKVVDLDGKPVEGILSQVCGVDVCVNGTTSAQGLVSNCDIQTQICSQGILPGIEERRGAFKYGDGFKWAKFVLLLPTDTDTYDVGTQVTAWLPPMSSGVDMTPGAEAASGGVTLAIAKNASVKVDKLTYTEPEEQRFRAVQVPIDKAPASVDKTLGFEIVFGTTPIDTFFCPKANLTVPNTPGWAPGTEVELFILGTSQQEEWAPYASWAKISGGTVSADGKTVSTKDDEGVGTLGTFAVKKK